MRANLKRRRGRRWVALGLAAAVLVLIAPAAPVAAPRAPAAFIVQASTTGLAAQAVAAVGGELTHRLEIINAVGARLADEQLAILRAGHGIRVYENRTAETAVNTTELGPVGDVEIGGSERVEHQGIDTEYPAFIDADKLHRAAIDGAGVTIAFLDTGVWTEGSQIERGVAQDGHGRDRILAQYNAVADIETSGPILAQLLDAPGVATDMSGHGTHISSVSASSYVAEAKGNLQLYNGVAPNADLVVVKSFDADGRGTYLDVIRGIGWVVANRSRYGIRVLNLSFSAEPISYYWDDPLNQAVMQAWQMGIVVVASAGNRGPDAMTIGVPGNVPYVITVGAMSDAASQDPSDDFLASFSSTGPTFEGFVKPEVLAPGGHVMGLMSEKSLIAAEHPEFHNGASYFTMSGTSQATAVVSGVAALMLQADPGLTPDDLKCRLMANARPAVEEGPVTGELKLAYSVFQQGAGLVNARDAAYDWSKGCANSGLDIGLDLAGTQHYGGRANRDESGAYYLDGLEGDGFTWSDGFLWSDGHKFHEGYAWNDGFLWSDGMVWSDGYTWSDGLLWSDGLVWSDGITWSDAYMAINRWVEQE